MDGGRFDAVTKAAMLGGRRALLRNFGLLAGGLTGLLGISEVDAQERRQRKPRAKRRKKTGTTARPNRQGVEAAAMPENPGRPPHECCAPCPATGNECTFPVRDASTGNCELVSRLTGLRCGVAGFCASDGSCVECGVDTLCPAPWDPSGNTFICENLERGGNAGLCGTCDNQCDENQELCCGGTCYVHGTCNCVCADEENDKNCSCQ